MSSLYGYNLHPGGRNKKMLQSTKDKLSASLKINSSLIGKKGPDHPNFGTKRSDKDRKAQSERLSGENGPNNKLTKEQVIEIYEYVMIHMSTTIAHKHFEEKYNMK